MLFSDASAPVVVKNESHTYNHTHLRILVERNLNKKIHLCLHFLYPRNLTCNDEEQQGRSWLGYSGNSAEVACNPYPSTRKQCDESENPDAHKGKIRTFAPPKKLGGFEKGLAGGGWRQTNPQKEAQKFSRNVSPFSWGGIGKRVPKRGLNLWQLNRTVSNATLGDATLVFWI